jgi:hypothetical protein
MNFEFNVEQVAGNADTSDRPKVDWDARAKYMVDTVGTQKKAKAMIGIISGIIDLGLQVQDDAKMEWKGTDEEREAVEAKAASGESTEYFETLPNDKGVPTLYKRWKVKPCQQVAFTVDFPSIMINQGQFFGDENAKEHPLRMLLNGEFYMKEVGKVVGKPYNIKEVRNDDGSWGFKSNTQIYKMASAVDVLDEKNNFKPHMIGKLLGKAALFEVQVYLQESGGKQYLNEKIKLSGQVPDVMVPMIPELAPEYIYGVNFKGEQNPEILKNLRQSVLNTMKLAQNFEGSDIQKALESARGNSQPADKPVQQKVVPTGVDPNTDEVTYDSFDDTIPF